MQKVKRYKVKKPVKKPKNKSVKKYNIKKKKNGKGPENELPKPKIEYKSRQSMLSGKSPEEVKKILEKQEEKKKEELEKQKRLKQEMKINKEVEKIKNSTLGKVLTGSAKALGLGIRASKKFTDQYFNLSNLT
jgi:uncharacterized protein with ParB-like and HNH nuclease domain